jgi:uncharacterized protein (TIGR02996 family)
LTHDDAFLEAVIAVPEDDTPRLVYADFLDEQGQADRTEFIRVQCALARMPRDEPRREELAAREQALLAAHQKEWAGPLAGLAEKCEFQRGFAEAVTLAGEDFLEHAEALFATAPVRDATFGSRWSDVPGTLARLAASPSVTRLEAVGLSFSNFCLNDTSLQALASLPPAPGAARPADRHPLPHHRGRGVPDRPVAAPAPPRQLPFELLHNSRRGGGPGAGRVPGAGAPHPPAARASLRISLLADRRLSGSGPRTWSF